MNQSVEFACRCGAVAGRVTGASPKTVNRLVCYCDDCQALLHYLGRGELLDAQGGSDIVQVAPASLRFERGSEKIVGVRLGEKGMFRWYSSCCKTPLGNTAGPKLPFVGVVAQAFKNPERDALFGPSRAAVFGKFAIGTAPEGSTRFNFRFVARVIRMLLGWRLGGQAWPNPFFERTTGAPRHPVHVLSAEARDALRPLCGPRPAPQATGAATLG